MCDHDANPRKARHRHRGPLTPFSLRVRDRVAVNSRFNLDPRFDEAETRQLLGTYNMSGLYYLAS